MSTQLGNEVEDLMEAPNGEFGLISKMSANAGGYRRWRGQIGTEKRVQTTR